MALQPINIGATGNDGTGDAARTAFQKVNANDAYLLSLIQQIANGTVNWGGILGDINDQDDLINLLLSLTGNNPSGSSLINPFYFNSSGTLTYFVGCDGYILNGTVYNTPVFGSVTLAESDETNNRFDVLVINQNGTVGVVQGTAAENPVIPLIDTNTQIAVTTILVEANTTEPADVVTDNVYNENAQIIGGEWDTTASGATVILDSEEQAETGTKSIKFNNAAAGAYVLFENNQDSSGPNLSAIKLSIYITQTHDYRFSLKIPATDGNSAPGILFESGQYGFSNTTLNEWQTIVIPATAFNGIAGIDFNSIQFSNERADSTFYVDQVQIQEGLNSVNNTLPNYTLELEANRLKLLKDGLVNSFVDLPIEQLEIKADIEIVQEADITSLTSSSKIGIRRNASNQLTELVLGSAITAKLVFSGIATRHGLGCILKNLNADRYYNILLQYKRGGAPGSNIGAVYAVTDDPISISASVNNKMLLMFNTAQQPPQRYLPVLSAVDWASPIPSTNIGDRFLVLESSGTKHSSWPDVFLSGKNNIFEVVGAPGGNPAYFIVKQSLNKEGQRVYCIADETDYIFKSGEWQIKAELNEEDIFSSVEEVTVVDGSYTFELHKSRRFVIPMTENTDLIVPALPLEKGCAFNADISGDFSPNFAGTTITPTSQSYDGTKVNRCTYDCYRLANGTQVNKVTIENLS